MLRNSSNLNSELTAGSHSNKNNFQPSNDCCFLENSYVKDDKCFVCMCKEKTVYTSVKCGICDISICGKCFTGHKIKQVFRTTEWGKFESNRSSKSEVLFNSSNMINGCMYSTDLSSVPTPTLIDPADIPVVPAIITLLKDTYGVPPLFKLQSNQKLSFILWQDEYMKKFYHFFPHRVCITILDKLAHSTAYLFIAEDSDNGHEIVSIAFDFTETSLHNILEAFKNSNPDWKSIKLLIVDTQLQNHAEIQTLFPDAYVGSCFYHLRKILCNFFAEKSSNTEQAEGMEYVKSIFGCADLICSEFELKVLYDNVLSQCHKPHLFGIDWNSVKRMQKVPLEEFGNILTSLNQYLENIDLKIKTLTCSESDLCYFTKKLIYLLKLLRRDDEARKKVHLQIERTYSFERSQEFGDVNLTTTAYKLIKKQFENAATLHVTNELVNGCYKFDHLGGTVTTSFTSCTCKFFASALLLCSHIFALRKAHNLPVFAKTLFDDCLTRQYLCNSYSSIYETSVDTSNLEPVWIDNLLPMMVKEPQWTLINARYMLSTMAAAYSKSCLVIPSCYGVDEEHHAVQLPSTNGITFQHSTTVSPLELASSLKCLNQESTEDNSPFSCKNVDWVYGKHLLNRKKINLLYLKLVICGQKKVTVNWLQHMGFLPNILICPSCNYHMTKSEVSTLTDGAIWICNYERKPKKICARRCSVRKSTWFEDTSMSLEKILMFCYMWSHSYPQQQILLELEISAATYSSWDKTFEKVIISSLDNLITNDRNQVPLDDMSALKVFWQNQQRTSDIFVVFLKEAERLYKKYLG